MIPVKKCSTQTVGSEDLNGDAHKALELIKAIGSNVLPGIRCHLKKMQTNSSNVLEMSSCSENTDNVLIDVSFLQAAIDQRACTGEQQQALAHALNCTGKLLNHLRELLSVIYELNAQS